MEYLAAPPLSMIMKPRRRVLFFDSNNQPRFSSYSHGKQRRPASSRNLVNFLGTKDPVFLDFNLIIWLFYVHCDVKQGLRESYEGQEFHGGHPTYNTSLFIFFIDFISETIFWTLELEQNLFEITSGEG